MILDAVQEDIKTARKAGKSQNVLILTTFLSEMKNRMILDRATTLEDVDAIKIINKTITTNNDVLKIKTDGPQAEKMAMENQLLSSYLPQQMTEEELSNAINRTLLLFDMPRISDMGNIMKELKLAYGGKYDPKQASSLVKAAIERIR